ncbi:hypothetical protein [Bacillus sp. FJAT-29814]|uniref:hypothetical protein n=1 Tax=Bacillus sp. FJAT-29814 TaxID=1729688 RepID=UPI000832306C|nr:hypothetical protein [Bacillus sp. FJAT-29814]
MNKPNKFLKLLLPKGNNTLEKESFEFYKGRVGSLASNIPDCVLENWIYRHYTCVVSDYSFLNFNKMQFTNEKWAKEDIYHLIKSFDDSWINNLDISFTNVTIRAGCKIICLNL